MRRALHLICFPILYLALIAAGCGGGGGGGGRPAATSVSIDGLVVAGRVSGSIVNIYGISSAQLTLVATTTTAADGSFSIVSASPGPLLLVAMGGSYMDEATGVVRSLGAAAPSRLDSVRERVLEALLLATPGSARRVVVSPLSTIAARRSAALSATRADALSEARLSEVARAVAGEFGVVASTDPLEVEPLDFTSPGDSAEIRATPGSPRASLGVLLCALSRAASDLSVPDPITFVDALASDFADGVLDGARSTGATQFVAVPLGATSLPVDAGSARLGAAARSFLDDPARNRSGLGSAAFPGLVGALDARDVSPSLDAPPGFAPISDVTILEDGTATATILGVTAGTAAEEAAGQSVNMTASTVDRALFPSALVVSGTGTLRSLALVPSADAAGIATISVTATDGTSTLTRLLRVTVAPVNDPPTLGNPGNVMRPMNAPGTIPIPGVGPGGGLDEAGQAVSLGLTSSDPSAFSSLTIARTPSAGAIVAYAPVVGRTGAVTLFVSASDGSSATSTAFDLTLSPAARLRAASGAGQSGAAGGALAAPLIVVVEDAAGRPVPDYPVAFSLSLGAATVSPAATLTDADGFARTTVALGLTAGALIIEARAQGLSGSPVTFGAVALPGPAARLAIERATSGALRAGETDDLTVRVLDGFGNTATSFLGPVSFSTSDAGPLALVPTPSAFAASDQGAKIFNAGILLVTAGLQTVSATSAGLAAGSLSVQVVAADVSQLVMDGLPVTPVAGARSSFTLTAADAFGNVATGFRGTVDFAVSDSAVGAEAPAPYTFVAGDAGVRDFPSTVRFVTAGGATLTASDVAAGIAGRRSVVVAPGAVASVTLTALAAPYVAGMITSVTVSARDPFGNPVHAGLVARFSSTDPSSVATTPTAGPLSGIDTTFSGVRLVTSGLRTVSVEVTSGTATILASGARSANVVAAAASALRVDAPAGVTAGAYSAVTVSALDPFGNRAVEYRGTVRFSSDDPSPTAEAPPDATFDAAAAGVVSTAPSLSLRTAGRRTLTVFDGGAPTLSAATSLDVAPAAPARLAVTASPSTGLVRTPLAPPLAAELLDAFGNRTSVSGLDVTVDIDANPGGAGLSGNLVASSAGGLVAFADLSLDRPGTGFTLLVTGTSVAGAVTGPIDIAPAPVEAFDLTTPPGVLGAIVRLEYTLRDELSSPASVAVEYAVGAGASFARATQAAGAPGEVSGTEGLTTSPGGVRHAFLWNRGVDLPEARTVAAQVRVRPFSRGVHGAGVTMTGLSLGPRLEFGAARFAAGGMPRGCATADFDGDGVPDVALANGPLGTVSVLLGRTEPLTTTLAAFESAVDVSTGGEVEVLVAADLDGDRRPDLVALDPAAGILALLVNETLPGGAATFSLAGTLAAPAGLAGVAAGDLDGDGRIDLAAVSEGAPGFVSGFKNTTPPGASPTFATREDTAVAPTASAAAPVAIAIADVHQGAFPDLLVVDSARDSVLVFRNTTAPGAAALSITLSAELPVASKPVAVAASDFDLDGRPDLAVACVDAGVVSVLLNRTPPGALQPTFTARLDADAGASPRALAIVDVDRNGRMDVVAAGDGGLTVLLGRTAPGAVAAAFDPRFDVTVAGGAGSVVGSDLDGGGSTDLIASASSQAGVEVLLNRAPAARAGHGLSTPLAVSIQSGSYAYHVGAADWNGDGKTDLAFLGASGAPCVVHGEGDGSFRERLDVSHVAELTVGDFTGDGRPDLVYASPFADTAHVYANTTPAGASETSFQAPVSLPTGSVPKVFAARDVDGDGRVDLLVLARFPSPSLVRVYLNETASGAAAPQFAGAVDFAAPSGSESMAIGDLDGDGRQDVVVGGPYGFSAWRSTASAGGPVTFSSPVSVTKFSNFFALEIVDVDGDGRRDVVGADAASHGLHVFLNRTAPGTPSLAFDGGTLFATGHSMDTIATHDLDGDGRVDLLVGSRDDTLHVYMNRCQAGTAPSFLGTALPGPYEASVADIDGDGRADVVLTDDGGRFAAIRLNRTPLGSSAPVFAESSLTIANAIPKEIQLVDANADGLLDIIARTTNNSTACYRNTTAPGGSLSFAGLVSVGGGPDGMAVADLDADGLPDLATVTLAGLRVHLNRSTSGGAIAFSSVTTFAGSSPKDIEAGDLDRDGRPDLVSVETLQNRVAVYRNVTAPRATSASFTASVTFLVLGQPSSVAVSDLDGDGALDLAVSCGLGVTILPGASAPGAPIAFGARIDVPVAMGAIVVVDIDRDGRPDIVGEGGGLLLNATPRGGTAAFVAVGALVRGPGSGLICVGDLDGDGRPDLGLSASATPSVAVYLNRAAVQGTPAFTSRFEVFGGHGGPPGNCSGAIGDLNGDGRADLVVGTNAIRVFLGR